MGNNKYQKRIQARIEKLSDIYEGPIGEGHENLENESNGEEDIVVDGSFVFHKDDLYKAKEWAKEYGYTYERDGDWAGLLIAAFSQGIIDSWNTDVELMNPEVLEELETVDDHIREEEKEDYWDRLLG